MYDEGQGVAQDHVEAVKWYRLAADQGDPDAQCSLGVKLHEGLGVAQDDGEAMRWYGLAAEQGHGGALYNLGIMYERGQGVERDLVQARAWNLLAVKVGNENAAGQLEGLAGEMNFEQIAESERLAEELRAKIDAAN
jgi:TPR repeat protein